MHVVNILEEGRGGGPLFGMVTSAAELKSKNIKTTIVYPKKHSKTTKELLFENGINGVEINLHHLTKYRPHLLLYLLFFIPEVILLLIHLKKSNYDIVICHGAYQIKGVLASKLANIPVIWHMNDSQTAKPLQFLFKYLSFLPNAWMFASEKSKAYYQSLNPNICNKLNKVIQSPIDINKFNNAKGNSTVISESNKIKLITISYLNENKNVGLII